MDIQIERQTPMDSGVEEEWARVTNEIDILGVSAAKVAGDWPWIVTITVAEFVRDDPLCAELQEAVTRALQNTPGVICAEQEDREVWVLQGEVAGSEIIRSCSIALDKLAPSLRKACEALRA